MGCEWQLGSPEEGKKLSIDRYDRVQSLYLTTGDFSALQQMNTVYPTQTRTLIEDVIRIGKVNDPEINTKFLRFYQDSTLQSLINEVERQYANMTDISEEIAEAFDNLKEMLPTMEIPQIYTQIGSLDQSVVIGNNSIGICLDKYLGADCPLYQKPEYGYTPYQLHMMNRSYIVPDCVGFYLLSLYPMPNDRALTQVEREKHIGKIQWVVNQVLGKEQFHTEYVLMADRYMKNHKEATIDQLLRNNRYTDFE
jgi:hypothetical protein